MIELSVHDAYGSQDVPLGVHRWETLRQLYRGNSYSSGLVKNEMDTGLSIE